ncbi:MAG: GtrA family protein [Paludibacteraceae bacterium]
MRKFLMSLGEHVTRMIDFFYPPFKKYVSLQFFRYGVSGALNLIFSWFSFFFIYQVVVQKRMINLGVVTLSDYTATVALNFVVTLITGFILQKYVTFTASELKGRKQLIRYAQVGLFNLLLNYAGIKLLVEVFRIFPSIANVIVSLGITVTSYFLQTRYTFPIKNNDSSQK